MKPSSRITTNAVLFHYVDGQLLVALTSLPDKPKEWHLPAATVGTRQTSLQALEHALFITCGLKDSDVTYREQLYTYEYIFRETATVCISYIYLSRELVWHKGTQPIGLFPITRLPDMSPKDLQTITYAHDRLRAKALYTTLPGFLLSEEFDLAAYQQVFEALTGKTADKRNFRKKLHSLDLFQQVDQQGARKKNQAIRYRLRRPVIELLPKSF